LIKNHLDKNQKDNIHAYKISTIASIMGTKGFDSNKSSVMDLIVTKALKLKKENKEEINILDLASDLSNVKLGS